LFPINIHRKRVSLYNEGRTWQVPCSAVKSFKMSVLDYYFAAV
jgi:hypothetical protein